MIIILSGSVWRWFAPGLTGCEPCRRKFICLWRKLLVMLGGLWRALFAGRQSWRGKLTRRKCRCWRDTRWIIGQRRDSFWRCCIMRRILCTRKSKIWKKYVERIGGGVKGKIVRVRMCQVDRKSNDFTLEIVGFFYILKICILQYVKENLENHSKKCSEQKRNTVILT